MTKLIDFPYDDDTTVFPQYEWLWVEAEVQKVDASFDAHGAGGVLSAQSAYELELIDLSIHYKDSNGNMVPLPKTYKSQRPKLILELETEVLDRATNLNWEETP